MSIELATAYVSIVPSFDKGRKAIEAELSGIGSSAGKSLSSNMGDEVDKSAKQGGVLHRAFSGIGGALVAATAGFGAIKLFGGFINEAQEAETMSKRTGAVIKSTGGAAKVTADQVSDLAGALSKKAGVDDEVIQSGANVLLTFTKVANQAGKGNDVFNQATGIALDMSSAMGTDLQGSIVQVGKALNDPIKGIGALSRVGVTFTDQQKEQIKALVKSGDVLGAQKVILKELNTEFGGAAAASATSGEKLQVAWGNIQETLGGLILPIFSKVAEWLADMLPGAADLAISAFDALREGIEYFVGGFTTDFTGEGTGVLYFLNVLGEAVGHAWDAVRDFAPKIWDAISVAFGAVWNFLSDIVPKIRDVIVGGFVAVRDWVVDVWPSVRDKVLEVVGAVVDWVKDYWPDVRDGVLDVLKAIVSWVETNWDGIKDTLKAVFDAFQTGASWVMDNKEVLIGALVAVGGYYVVLGVQAVAAGIAAAAAWIAAAAIPILIGLAVAGAVAGFIYLYNHIEGFRTAVDETINFLTTAWDNYGEQFMFVLSLIGQAIKLEVEIWLGMWQMIIEIVKGAIDMVTAIIEHAIAAWNALWPVTSFVIDVFHGAFDMVVEIVKGAITMISALIEGGIMVWNAIWATISFFYDIFRGARDMVVDIARGMIDTVRGIIEGGVQAVQTTWNAIVGVYNFFRDYVYNPLISAVGGLVGIVSGLFAGAVIGATIAWGGIVGIYNFFRDNVYNPLKTAVEGITNGTVAAFTTAVDLVRAVWDGLKEAVGAPIRVVVGFYNNGIAGPWNFVAGYVGLPQLPIVKLATGGTVPGTGNKDTVPAMLTPGEYVLTKDAAKAWGPELLKFLNDPRNAKGKTVDPGIFGYSAGGPVYRAGDDVLNFAKQQVGKPYSYSAGGSGNADCSYLWSVLVNYALGAANPYTRRWSTGTISLRDTALASGLTDLATGFNMGVRPPYQVNKAGQFVGHMAGTLMGVNFESTPPATRMSPAARGAVGFPVNYNLPGFGGPPLPTAAEQEAANKVASLTTAQIGPTGGGTFGDIITGLFKQLPGAVFDLIVHKLPEVIFNAVKDAVGGAIETLGAIGSTIGGAAQAAGSFLNPLNHLEHGGTVPQTGPIVVGERRPEVLWANRGQYVQASIGSETDGRRRPIEVHNHYHTRNPTATELAGAIRMAQLRSA